MDYKYIEQLMERYWNAETSLEEESILRTFFSQENIPAEMEQWKPLFKVEAEGPSLGDDFDARILSLIQDEEPAKEVVKVHEITLKERLMPFFKAAAVIAIILTLGGALQAPWDNSWNAPVEEYANFKADTVDIASPVQAENIIADKPDSTNVMMPEQSKN